MVVMSKNYLICSAALLLAWQSLLEACPVSVSVSTLSPRMRAKRSEVVLFAKQPQNGKITPLATQVDPLDSDGRHLYFTNDSWRRDVLSSHDLLHFYASDFGNKIDLSKESLPCQGEVVFEVSNKKSNRFAYLTSCAFAFDSARSPSMLQFSPAKSLIESPSYSYKFDKNNYLQFEEVKVFSNGPEPLLIKNSKMFVYADIKRFFDVQFGAGDIRSELVNYRIGDISHLANLSFYLKFLFFEINLDLSLNAAFYNQSGSIPMVLTAPYAPKDYLNPGSGVLYTWQKPSSRGIRELPEMPRFNPEDLLASNKRIDQVLSQYCEKQKCFFAYKVSNGPHSIGLQFILAKQLVKKGFFPTYIEAVKEHADEMGWDGEAAEEGRRAIYFEISGLPEGEFFWDFWVQFNEAGQSFCPENVEFRRVK